LTVKAILVKHRLMARHKGKIRREKRGRPRKANARRRATTVAARRSPDDLGTPELLAHRALATGSGHLPDDLLGTLHGRGVLDAEAYTTGREFASLVRLVHLGFGLTEASPAGTWRNIVAATSGGGARLDGYPGAERARRALARFKRDMGKAAWTAVSDAVDSVWPKDLAGFVIDLRLGLDYLAQRLPLSARSAL
jgi:hypothetical protein